MEQPSSEFKMVAALRYVLDGERMETVTLICFNFKTKNTFSYLPVFYNRIAKKFCLVFNKTINDVRQILAVAIIYLHKSNYVGVFGFYDRNICCIVKYPINQR